MRRQTDLHALATHASWQNTDSSHLKPESYLTVHRDTKLYSMLKYNNVLSKFITRVLGSIHIPATFSSTCVHNQSWRATRSLDQTPHLWDSYTKAWSPEHIEQITLCCFNADLVYSVGLHHSVFLAKEGTFLGASVHQDSMLTYWWPGKKEYSPDATAHKLKD